ncbi:MAG: CHAT domain-containing protein [Bryobacterales bacterium]|nr:CHAT domain-containing protein [Bryobacterales bacterium]
MSRQAILLAALVVLPAFAAPAGLVKQGDTAEGRISAANAAIHELRIEAGQFFYAQVNGIRMSLDLTAPSGHSLWPSGRTAVVIAPETGLYRLKVRTAAPTLQRYLLTVNYWRPALPSDPDRLDAIRILTAGYTAAERATAESRAAAIERYREARQKALALADTWLEARCLLSEAMAHSALGNSDAALLALHDALAVYQARRDRGGEAYTWNQAALLLAYRAEFARAFDYYRRALAYWREKGDSSREREVLRNLAIAHAMAGNLQTAVETYRQVIDGFRLSGDKYNEAVTLVQLSDLYLSLGDYEQAIALAAQALPMHRAHHDQTAEVHTLSNLGEALAAQGKHAGALVPLRKAMDLGNAAGLGWLHATAQALTAASEQALGRLQIADSLYRGALAPMQAHGNRDGASRLLVRLGMLALERGRLDAAATQLDEALRLAEGLPNGVAHAYALTAIAALKRAQGNLDAARQLAAQALDVIENSRLTIDDKQLRATFLASRAASYDFAIDLAIERKDAAGAFAILQRFRARNLADMLAVNRRQAPSETALLPDLIPQSTAILSYHFGEKRSWLFVHSNEGTQASPLPPAAAIEPQVRQLRALLAQPSRATLGRYVQTASELFRLCVRPALPLLASSRSLVISADGPLHYLPFEALLTATPTTMAYRSLPYLLSRWKVSYAPSAASFVALQRRAVAPSGHELVAFGDPRGDLPGAATELREIAKLFPNGRALVFPGLHAAKDALLQSAHLAQARRIHFATHGLLKDASSATSGLLFANGALLSASDLLGLKWNAELVVLSACETGLGPRLRGEGILGFTRALLLAGVSSVAVSLWPISDESTVALMVEFYGRLSRGEPTSEALRQAKLHLLRSGAFAHPYYWASIILSGKV